MPSVALAKVEMISGQSSSFRIKVSAVQRTQVPRISQMVKMTAHKKDENAKASSKFNIPLYKQKQ